MDQEIEKNQLKNIQFIENYYIYLHIFKIHKRGYLNQIASK